MQQDPQSGPQEPTRTPAEEYSGKVDQARERIAAGLSGEPAADNDGAQALPGPEAILGAIILASQASCGGEPCQVLRLMGRQFSDRLLAQVRNPAPRHSGESRNPGVE